MFTLAGWPQIATLTTVPPTRTDCGRFHDDDLAGSGRSQVRGRDQPDRARPEDQRRLAAGRAREPNRVVGDGQRLDQGAEVGGEVAERVGKAGVDHAVLREAAATAGQANEAEGLADVVAAHPARRATSAGVVGLDRDPVVLGQAVDALSHFGDRALDLGPGATSGCRLG
jgi:hypothetical protein